MNTTKFENIVNLALREVDLAGSSSNKFDRLLVLLGGHWKLDPELIGVKTLAASKNYGNRISEATRSQIELLVLLADEKVNLKALARSLQTRALKLVPTVLLVRKNGVWSADTVFLSIDHENPFDVDAPVETLKHRATTEIDRGDTEEVAGRILALDGAPVGTDIEAHVHSLLVPGARAVIKRVTDVKNLSNRISEAVSQRPQFLLVHVPKDLIESARRILDDQLGSSPTTHAFIVFDVHDRISLIRITSEKEPGGDAVTREHAPATLGETGSLPPVMDLFDARPEEVDRQYRKLERVKQLCRFLPFDGNANRLYEERQESPDRLSYDSRTLAYVQQLLAHDQRVIIVLTGNAGHGKTHLCRRLLEANGANSDVMQRLHDDPSGKLNWNIQGARRPVRIVKDLSEVNPPEKAADNLEGLLQQAEAHVVVCANEGRLRDVVSRKPKVLGHLVDALQWGLERGETSAPGHADVHVLNLNYQASSSDGGGFFAHVLDHFLNHESAWKVCRICSAGEDCPIFANRNDLARSSASSPENVVRREALQELVRVAEEGGYVLTFRETLELVSYIVTGNLSCSKVEELHRNHRLTELRQHRVLPLLFEQRLADDNADILPLLQRLRRLDPGLVALRPVDDVIHARLDAKGRLGRDVFGEGARQYHLRADLQHEMDDHREMVRQERREAWFTSPPTADSGLHRVERLGLRYHHIFRGLQGTPDQTELIKTIRLLVRGLHTIQGALGVDSTSNFHLVDPAFGRSGSHASVIARSIRIKDLELMAESKWWKTQREGVPPPILDSVEWIDRRVVLVNKQEVVLALDLLAFEFVMGAAFGIVMRDFHSAERRRILRTLARQAESGRESNDDIRVLVGRGEGRLIIERDHTILLERHS
jgi:hypothetical protein